MRVLKGDEKEFGEEHPHTLDSVYNLARLYDAIGELDKALPLYQRELAGCTKYYGKTHEETGHSAVNLANVRTHTRARHVYHTMLHLRFGPMRVLWCRHHEQQRTHCSALSGACDAQFFARFGDKDAAEKVAQDYSLVPTPQEEDGWKQEGKAGQPAA